VVACLELDITTSVAIWHRRPSATHILTTHFATRSVPIALILLLLASLLSGQAHAQSSSTTARVDSIFARWNSRETPGCAVGVARNGSPVLTRSYGMADLERDVAATPTTIYEAGSVSKQFTATAIILLAHQGKLSLDDDIRKYVPEVPDYGTTIRIRNLLNHTSGIRDWGSVAAIAGWGRSVRTHTHAHVLDILSRQRALNFPPGEQYSYSNSGYNLLAVVVDRVSGMPFAEFSKKFIFEPLGMNSTQWRDDWTRIVKGRAIAYAARGNGFAIDNPIENVFGNGGLLTTVGDLLLWNENLNTGAKLGGKFYVDEMHHQGVLTSGQQIAYASGIQVGTFAGTKSVSHTGSTSGFRAFLARYPDQQVSVALLCNIGAVNPGTLGQQVARIFLAPTVATAGGRGAAPVIGGDDPNAPTANAAGRGRGAPSYSPPAADLQAYVGEYYSPDAETALTVSIDNGQLIARRRPATRIALTPTERDAFSASGGLGAIRFIRDASDKVVQLSVRQARVFDLRFDRTK
jgi:CubicO group peptidase (beta-lactamase class C family)